ncbi:MAG: response regulator [Candidatus Obscuribacterales bacterium]|nr:response regulator [Steroidobacteraceae bacterium]
MATPSKYPLVKNRSVVIVDDDDVTRELLRGILRTAGLQILGEGNDGNRAVFLYQKFKPEIICLDIDMPEMNGLEALAKIREQSADVIVLMISAATTGENVRAAIAGRANGIIAKPFNTAKIVAEIERALTRATDSQKPTPKS